MRLLRVRDLLIRVLRLGQATLREIFDESAYERFLARRKVNSTRQAYAEFLRDRADLQSRRHRCC